MISKRTATRQFDVFENPIARARRAYPFVAVLQSDRAETGRDRIVAPLVPHARLSGTAGRLTPHVKVSGVDHVLLVPGLTAIAAADLHDVQDELTSHRDNIMAALDYLFLGV
jgi:toxin CcdB